MREAMTHKELRRVVRERVVEAVQARAGQPKIADGLEHEFEQVVGDDGGLEVEVRVRDLALPAPPKGERPWHVYRVVVQERQA